MKKTKSNAPAMRPRIVEVAEQIAVIQSNRLAAEDALAKADLKSESIQTQIDVLDSEQRTLEREMDSLTRSMTPRG